MQKEKKLICTDKIYICKHFILQKVCARARQRYFIKKRFTGIRADNAEAFVSHLASFYIMIVQREERKRD